tara:strand:- start:9 stop:458 length:450 start_codon:yes stop_codon:yes gene_type:complete
MNIQELETKYKELGAEIQRLKQQPEGVWEPEESVQYWRINWNGTPITTRHCGNLDTANHNVYETEELAEKASVLQRRANLVIQACLNFDPDFVPNWSNPGEIKYAPYYDHRNQKWCSCRKFVTDESAAYISTQEIADKVVAYLNTREIK